MIQELDYDQYDYYCCIYLDHNLINLSVGSNLNQQVEASFALAHFERHPAAFTYDRNTGEIIDWGRAADETFDNEIAPETQQSSRFFQRSILAEINRLYENQVKNKETGHLDEIRFKAIGKFLAAVCNQAQENSANQLSNSHFVFILPTEWDYNIRTQFIPRLFHYGGITSPEDPENRIIFTTVLECTVAAMQEEHYSKKYDIQYLREEKYLHFDLYLDDLESPAELVLQAFQVEDEQTLTDSTAIFERTNRLLVLKLVDTFSQNAIELASCKSVAFDFKSNADFLMDIISEDWKEKFQSCLNEIASFDEKEVNGTNTDRASTVSKSLSYATLIRSTCADRKTIFTAIEDYLNCNNHRQIDSIVFTLHDSLPKSQRKFSDLYFYCMVDSLKHFRNTKIRTLGESRWAFPKFGGPEIIRGGLFRLLESLKFANTEGPPSIDNIHDEDASSHLGSGSGRSDSPFVCGHSGCGWAFVHSHDTEAHRLLHNKAKPIKSKPTFWNPRIPRQQDSKQDLFLVIDITIESTQLSLSVLNKQYKTFRKINLADTCLLGLPPLSYFISLSPEESGRMALTTKKIFFDLVNDLYHQAFYKFCNENDNAEPHTHGLGAFNSKFTFDDYYKYFANSDLVWSSEVKNYNRMSELEEIYYYNRSCESNEHTSANLIHVITFILLYVGYVYHKLGMILEQQKKEMLQDIDLNSETKVMLVLQDLLLNILPLDALNNHEVRLKLCGFRGKSSEVSTSKSNFSVSMLQQSLSPKNDKSFIRSYYAHAKISEEKINLDLNQIIEFTKANMPLFLKHHLMEIDQTNDSISKKMWAYIWKRHAEHPRKEDHLHFMNTKTYLSFKLRISRFISKILCFSKHAQKSRGGIGSFYDKKYQFEYQADCEKIALSLREIVEIAIKPSMRTIAVSILSVFRNIDAFALYNTETLLVTGKLLSPYYSYGYRTLVSSILQKELLELLKSSNLVMDIKFSIEPASTDSSTESLDKVLFIYQQCLKKSQISTRSRHNYALKFNFEQDLFVEDYIDEQQSILECSSKDYVEIPANYLYILLTWRTMLRQFSRYFKTELGNTTNLESIELVKFEEPGRNVTSPGGIILAVAVSYTVVHRFNLENMRDSKIQNLPLVLNVTPLHYLSLLEVSVEIGKNEENPSRRIMASCLLREKQSLSYDIS